MFLLVSVRHVGAYPGGHQHGVFIQISINWGKTFLRISRIRNIPLTWNLARVFAYIPPFISQILGLSIERFWYFFWSILNGVTLKTSNLVNNRNLSGKFNQEIKRNVQDNVNLAFTIHLRGGLVPPWQEHDEQRRFTDSLCKDALSPQKRGRLFTGYN